MNKNLFTLTLLKAIDILDCFESDQQEVGIKEIAEMIDMPQSSVYRIVQSLEFSGLIFQNKSNKKYRLGMKMARMKSKVEALDVYTAISLKHMRELNSRCDETINMGMLECDKIVNLHKVESTQMLRPNFICGTKYPSYNTALGNVLLAEFSLPVMKWVYETNKEGIGKDFESFRDNLLQIRKQGYAFDDEAFSEGLRCVAAPVKVFGGCAPFSISLSAPTIRMNDQAYLVARDMVVETAGRIAEEIERAAF